MPTLSEVARIAGVTTATVSNVLRNPGKVKDSTVKRVKEAIAQTGYRPNLMARALAGGKSSMLGMVLPNINNPFYPEFIRTAERVARQRKYFLMVCNTDEQPEIGLAYLRQISGTLADGVLVLHTGIGAKEILEHSGRRAPVVLASEETVDYSDTISHVAVDFRLAGQIAGQHLIGLGHRRIGVIVGGGLDGCQMLRLEGFKDALAQSGLTFDENSVTFVPDSIEDGYQAAATLLEKTPELTAIFASNDLLAFGASQQLTDRGIQIPKDVSIIGITDIQLAKQIRPALTTVSLGIEAIATISVNLLLDLIENPDAKPTLVQAPKPTLVVRSSTARPPSQNPARARS